MYCSYPYLRYLHAQRRRLNQIPGVWVFGRDRCAVDALYDLDVTKLTINVTGMGMTGFMALDVLNEEFGIQSEMATLHNVLLIVTIGNVQRDLDRVVEAFSVMSARAKKIGVMGTNAIPTGLPLPSNAPEALMTPREAFFAATDTIP